jgi:hypothetical protein
MHSVANINSIARSLFSDAVSSADYIASNDWTIVDNELQMMC